MKHKRGLFDAASHPSWLFRILGLLALLLASPAAMAQETAAERACADALQGKVAWNQQGDTGWAPGNLRRLCQGTTDPAATVNCFRAQVRAHNDWARGINACQAGAAPAPAAETTGRNVTIVAFGQGGQRLGQFRQVAPRLWVEINRDGVVAFRFEEVQRDDWSVYLVDRSRGVNLQLDLHTRKVMYSDATQQRAELYAILAAGAGSVAGAPASPPPAAAAEPENGRTDVNWVGYGELGSREVSGYLRRSGPREWQELNHGQTRVLFRFEEVQRDQWSIYLVDRSRGVNLQIDLHTMKVMYSDASSPRRELYQVVRFARE
jgi:hypothetical protein